MERNLFYCHSFNPSKVFASLMAAAQARNEVSFLVINWRGRQIFQRRPLRIKCLAPNYLYNGVAKLCSRCSITE